MKKESENPQALYEHKLQVQRLVLDKLLIALLVVVVGFAANFIIERYRVQSTRERFLLEKKLEAVQEISEAYFAMHNTFDGLMLRTRLNEGHYKSMKSQIDNFVNVWTHNSVILSSPFTRQMDYVTWIYIALSGMDLENMRTYRSFFFDIYSKFYLLTKEELGLEVEPSGTSFNFVEWPFEKADALGAENYFLENYKQWQTTKGDVK